MSETGLPALPENYFWRVRHHETRVWGVYQEHIDVDKIRLQVVLVHTSTETVISTVSKHWYRKAKNVTNTYERESNLFVQDAEGTNPIAVRNAANRIMKLWEKTKARDALVGDYPPKTLEVGE